MSKQGPIIQTVRYEKSDEGSIKSVDSVTQIYSPSTSLHVVRFPEQNSTASIAYHEMTNSQLWNQLEKVWCDMKTYPDGAYKEYLLESSKIITIFTEPSYLAKYIDTRQYYMNFSDSIGTLINIETLKNRAVIPVSTLTTTSYMSGDEVSPLPGDVNYNTIYSLDPNSKTSNSSYKTINITKKIHDLSDNIFKQNMFLIKDPLVVSDVTTSGSKWSSIPSVRADGIGEVGNTVKKGTAHGRNLVTDSRHYDRMHACYTDLVDLLQDRLDDMYRAWEYKRSHGHSIQVEKIYTEHTVENQILTVDVISYDKIDDSYRRRRTNKSVFG